VRCLAAVGRFLHGGDGPPLLQLLLALPKKYTEQTLEVLKYHPSIERNGIQ
jgi:hypothetical protein